MKENNEESTPNSFTENAEENDEEILNKFTRKLLAAEDAFYRPGSEAFSRSALELVLKEFCNIIAESCGAESCTVHLKLYDSKPLKTELGRKGTIFQTWLEDADKKLFPMANSPDKCKETRKSHRRHRLWQSPLTFPLWRFPKGALELVAWNTEGKKSAWSILDPAFSDGKYADFRFNRLSQGISTEIVQDTSSKIRNRFQIPKSRGMLKLGGVDMLIWDNRDWQHVFRNYCGVPIRLHPHGEVVGILKAENRKLKELKSGVSIDKTNVKFELSSAPPWLLEALLKARPDYGLASPNQLASKLLGTLLDKPGEPKIPPCERLVSWLLEALFAKTGELRFTCGEELASWLLKVFWGQASPESIERAKVFKPAPDAGKVATGPGSEPQWNPGQPQFSLLSLAHLAVDFDLAGANTLPGVGRFFNIQYPGSDGFLSPPPSEYVALMPENGRPPVQISCFDRAD